MSSQLFFHDFLISVRYTHIRKAHTAIFGKETTRVTPPIPGLKSPTRFDKDANSNQQKQIGYCGSESHSQTGDRKR
jgi:hypothetical protein